MIRVELRPVTDAEAGCKSWLLKCLQTVGMQLNFGITALQKQSIHVRHVAFNPTSVATQL